MPEIKPSPAEASVNTPTVIKGPEGTGVGNWQTSISPEGQTVLATALESQPDSSVGVDTLVKSPLSQPGEREVTPATFPTMTRAEAADANAAVAAQVSAEGNVDNALSTADASAPTGPEATPTPGGPAAQPESGNGANAAAGAEAQTTTTGAENNASGATTPENGQGEVRPGAEQTPAVSGEVITPEQRRDELAQKVRDGSATQEDFAELNELNTAQRGEARRQELTDRLANGEALTSDEFTELSTLRSEGSPTAEAELTPEQKLSQEVEDMGTQLLMDMAKEPKTLEERLALNDKVDAFKGKWAEMQMLKSGFTEEQARAAMKAAMGAEVAKGGQKEIALEKEVMKKIQEMRAIEMRLMMIPKMVEGLKKQHETVKDSIKRLGPPGVEDSAQMINARQENYAKMNQLARIKSQIVNVKSEESLLQSQHIDTMQYVRRKLGVTSGMEAVGEWVGAKMNVLSVQGVRSMGQTESFMTLDDIAA